MKLQGCLFFEKTRKTFKSNLVLVLESVRVSNIFNKLSRDLLCPHIFFLNCYKTDTNNIYFLNILSC